ncbi:unnamed protein product [Rotaria magnacalcarata]|uniref:Uncharacterized protein n=1 Tax=Rotaria magnacalcarata TaxID=392030 RepID=A0A816ZBE3_9BILA|nr:unnamed protein product [Rotaria magnacalcarata]
MESLLKLLNVQDKVKQNDSLVAVKHESHFHSTAEIDANKTINIQTIETLLPINPNSIIEISNIQLHSNPSTSNEVQQWLRLPPSTLQLSSGRALLAYMKLLSHDDAQYDEYETRMRHHDQNHLSGNLLDTLDFIDGSQLITYGQLVVNSPSRIDEEYDRLKNKIGKDLFHLDEYARLLNGLKKLVSQSNQKKNHLYIHYFLRLHSLSHRLPAHLLIYLSIDFSVIPLRGCSVDIHPNARWKQNGLTVAGGNGQGNGINQLSYPHGLYVDDDQTVYVADQYNHRIVEWKSGATSGQVVAGGNGQRSGDHQLSQPLDVIVDKETNSLIISDNSNKRVVRWPRRNGTSGETIISNIDCEGLTMDENGSLYVVDNGNDEVRRYKKGESQGTVVAGGNGRGDRFDQLSIPTYVFVDRDHSVYVSEWGNHRVMKWMKGKKEGIIVAGGQGKGNGLTQLSYPGGVVVDQLGTVYVADDENDRIMCWPKGATQGSVIVGGNGGGGQSNQLNGPEGSSFDRHGNLYVVDYGNHRVQKFNIEFICIQFV